MGQKVNPNGIRLGINRTWSSRWFSKNDYSKIHSFKALETMNHRGPDNINYKIKHFSVFKLHIKI